MNSVTSHSLEDVKPWALSLFICLSTFWHLDFSYLLLPLAVITLMFMTIPCVWEQQRDFWLMETRLLRFLFLRKANETLIIAGSDFENSTSSLQVKIMVNLKGRENEFRNNAIELVRRFQADVGEVQPLTLFDLSEFMVAIDCLFRYGNKLNISSKWKLLSRICDEI